MSTTASVGVSLTTLPRTISPSAKLAIFLSYRSRSSPIPRFSRLVSWLFFLGSSLDAMELENLPFTARGAVSQNQRKLLIHAEIGSLAVGRYTVKECRGP